MTAQWWLAQQHWLLVRAIRQRALPLPIKHLLLQVLQQSLEQADLEEAAGNEVVGLGGPYHLTKWALQCKVARATLHHALQQAEEAELRCLIADPDDAAVGILIWTIPGEARPSRHRPALTRHQVNRVDHPDDPAQSARTDHQAGLNKPWPGRPPRQVWAALRRQVLERDEQTCQYCSRRTGKLACDHVLPVSRGGRSTLDNLVTACQVCNGSKGPKTVEEWRLARKRQPGQEER